MSEEKKTDTMNKYSPTSDREDDRYSRSERRRRYSRDDYDYDRDRYDSRRRDKYRSRDKYRRSKSRSRSREREDRKRRRSYSPYDDEKYRRRRRYSRERDDRKSPRMDERLKDVDLSKPGIKVYINNIHYNLDEDDIKKTFELFGPLKSVAMAKDDAGKHKGYCFIEYISQDAAELAIKTMNNFILGGRQLKVELLNEKTEKLAKEVEQQKLEEECKVYVGSLPWEMTEEELKRAFEPYGEIKKCTIMTNPETGRSKGYGILEFAAPEQASKAIYKMRRVEMYGRRLKVGKAMHMIPTGSGRRPEGSLSQEESLTISGNQRLLVMQKLTRANKQKPSRIIVLRNMVLPGQVDKELEEEVTSECTKFGQVERVVIYEEKVTKEREAFVDIFVIFKDEKGSQHAQQALNQRYFAGRVVTAEFYDENEFDELVYRRRRRYY